MFVLVAPTPTLPLWIPGISEFHLCPVYGLLPPETHFRFTPNCRRLWNAYSCLQPSVALSQAKRHVEGTGVYTSPRRWQLKKILLVMVPHVLSPSKEQFDLAYSNKNTHAPRRNLVLNTRALNQPTKSIKPSFGDRNDRIELNQRRMRACRKAWPARTRLREVLQEAIKTIEALVKFYVGVQDH